MAAAYPFIPHSGSFVAAPSAYHNDGYYQLQQQQQQAAYGAQAGYGSYPAYSYGGNQMGAQASPFAVPTSGSFTYGGGAPAGPPRTASFTYNTPAAVPTTGSFAYAADPYANGGTTYGFPTPGLFGYGAGSASYGGGAPYAGSGFPNSMLPGAGSFSSTPQFQFFPEPSSGSGTAPAGGRSNSASGNTGTGPIPSGGDAPGSARPSRPDSEKLQGRPPLPPAKQVPLTTTKLKKKKTCGCC